ncbi:hypothetical protein CISG_08375 [Coccidioides immitis RMSCC 3703]|uniref:Cytochrome P450 n=1 Tax=Coccidioides immitis RMSCC 3703 TaxID=454286 RepID=A0A0J8R573_COCIT|nr:hypothetical protein CISG_08375 [Coccidioides immitis RMSCC 3703]
MLLLAGTLFTLAFVIYKKILYPLFFSPLAKIPSAHPLASVSSLWIQWKRLTNKEFDAVVSGFRQKGPYIRLAPKEVAVNTMECGVKNIYGIGNDNFDKAPWYNFFQNHGFRNTFCALGSEHALYRRRISGVYSKSFLQSSPHIRAILDAVIQQRILPILARTAEKEEPIDILALNLAYGLGLCFCIHFWVASWVASLFGIPARTKAKEKLEVATRDTFGITFSYVILNLSRNLEIQEQLRQELLSISQPFRYHNEKRTELPTPQTLEALPFLNAVIKESLRLRNTAPTLNPRITPTGRKVTIGPCDNVPAGTRVGAFAWCLHRNEKGYPNPRTWDPMRWIVDSSDPKAGARERWCDAFCCYCHYTNFRTSIIDDSAFAGDETFVTGDGSEQLILKIERVET